MVLSSLSFLLGKHTKCLGAAYGSDQNIGEFGCHSSFITYSMVFGNLAYLSQLHCFHKQRRDKMFASQDGCGNGMREFQRAGHLARGRNTCIVLKNGSISFIRVSKEPLTL